MTEHKAVARPGSIKFHAVLLKELHFDAREAVFGAPGTVTGDVGVTLRVELSEDKLSATVTLDVRLQPQDTKRFHELRVVVDGAFEGSAETKGLLEEFATKQGPSLLFPFVREIIANVTARSAGGAILLPPLNLYDAVAQKASAASDQ